MLNELKHVFDGVYKGFTTEARQNNGQTYNVDILVIDEGLDRYRITCKRADADDLKSQLVPDVPIRVEALVRPFPSGLGVSYLRILPPISDKKK